MDRLYDVDFVEKLFQSISHYQNLENDKNLIKEETLLDNCNEDKIQNKTVSESESKNFISDDIKNLKITTVKKISGLLQSILDEASQCDNAKSYNYRQLFRIKKTDYPKKINILYFNK